MSKSEFEKYATGHAGISSLKLHQFKAAAQGSISPTIIEERQMNVAAMDVFSRLMMDRIIFLGCPVYDDVANIIQAQLLFLESTEPDKDIQIYINSPGGSVTAGLGIYDTMQLISSDVATICTGLAASMGADALFERQAYLSLLHTDPAFRRRGLGGWLVTAMANALAAEGWRCAFFSEPHNLPFYRQLGFAPAGTMNCWHVEEQNVSPVRKIEKG